MACGSGNSGNLVLARKAGECVVIAGCVHVTVLEIRNGVVKLGIRAPKEITVDRLELHEAKQREAGNV